MQRFAITHINKDGLRTLTFANQGRNHYDTREQAQAALDEYIAAGDLRSKVLGDMANTLEVREVECYENGDAKRIYTETEQAADNGNITIEQFISKHNLKFECRRVESRADGLMGDREMRHFRCKVICPTKTRTILSDAGREPSFSVYFSQGSAHTTDPTLADVLDCLASDASGFEATHHFGAWAHEYGYDTDSRQAEKTFKTIKRQAEQLKRTLGQEAYAELLYSTERL